MIRIKVFLIGLFALFALIVGATRYAASVEGQGLLSPPTRLIASDNDYNNKVGLNWDPVRGATLYRIFRNISNDPASATAVGTTAAPIFFDTSAAAGQVYFYWVTAENQSGASGFGEPDTGRRTGTQQQGPVPPLDPPPPAPPGNPTTAAKFELGKILFWDEQLSSTLTVSCGTCHRPASGGADPRTVFNSPASQNPGFDTIFDTADDVFGSPGVPRNTAAGLYEWLPAYGLRPQVTGRKSPSYINAVYAPLLFWDGRATGTFRDPVTNAIVLNNGAALESQSAGPPVSDAEMAHAGRNWLDAAAQIAASKPLALSASVPANMSEWIGGRTYPELFDEAFGSPDVTPARIAMAIASFERLLFSDRTPLDRANAGIAPLTAQEQRGRNIFNASNCNTCHGGDLLTDNNFHNIGVRPQNEDPGRAAVTGNTDHLGAFRTPSLRNVALRGPYMRNGRFATLEDVVNFYDRGGDFPGPNTPDVIQPLGLSPSEKADLVAFLQRPLTDPRVADESAPFDRPQLYTESNRVPVLVDSGTNGSGGRLPEAIAIEPPLAGNPSFTVGVSNALGGSNAVLVINSSDPGNTSNIPASGSFVRQVVQLGGSGAGAGYGSVSLAIPSTPAVVGQTFFGRWYITDAGAAGGVAVTQAFRFTVFGDAVTPARRPFDYDGDGKSDVSVFRPSTGLWYLLRSTAGYTGMQWGEGTDKITPADYDGDGKTDVAVFRASTSTWYIFNSATQTFSTENWGQTGDLAVPADYDGDGKADVSVYRPSDANWYRKLSGGGFSFVNFGTAEDKPVPADWDGDGKADIGVFRPSSGIWYFLRTTAGFTGIQWGVGTDIHAPGDYDGDGKTDVAVFRPENGTWYLGMSTLGFASVAWGQAGDIPSAGDFDGDGKTDVAVFRPSNGHWYILNSTAGIADYHFGENGDVPTESAFTY